MPTLCRKLVSNPYFFEIVLALLVMNALCLGVDASSAVAVPHENIIAGLLIFSQAVFVLEITIRICAFGPRPLRFFSQPWNMFDFTVVALSLLPAVGGLGILSRLLRLLRLVRFASVSAALQSFVSARVHELSSLVSAALMLLMFGYLMSLAGFYLFAAHLSGWSDLAEAARNVANLIVFRLPVSSAEAHSVLSIPAGMVYLVLLYAGVLGVVLLAVCELRGVRSSMVGESR